ncbi:MAG: LytTR family DNA-binding domain-containing protein [Saprospiraceae bacterium]
MSHQLPRILIVDDEVHNRKGIKRIIEESDFQYDSINEAAGAAEARAIVNSKGVDIILLDINMPKENGFEFLDSVKTSPFLTIFITAYTEHAIRAFKANAIDYILKPVDEFELLQALQKSIGLLPLIQKSSSWLQYKQALDQAADLTPTQQYPGKLTLPHSAGFHMVQVQDITHLEADGNYTHLHFIDAPGIMTSRPIREFEEILDPAQFFRIHKSSIINIYFLKSYSTSEGSEAILTNGKRLPVSRRRLEDFMNAINAVSRKI